MVVTIGVKEARKMLGHGYRCIMLAPSVNVKTRKHSSAVAGIYRYCGTKVLVRKVLNTNKYFVIILFRQNQLKFTNARQVVRHL